MASATPKLAIALDRESVARWLAEAIQEKAAKENAGLVEIALAPADSTRKSPVVTISTNKGNRRFEITVTSTG